MDRDLHDFSMSNQMEFGGSTYDSVQGWLIWGRIFRSSGSWDYDMYDERDVFSLETTKDGRLFEPFPSPPDNLTYDGKVYLESLNNGGDIFAMGSGKEETYIFRKNSSIWERQSDSPLAGPPCSEGKLKKCISGH